MMLNLAIMKFISAEIKLYHWVLNSIKVLYIKMTTIQFSFSRSSFVLVEYSFKTYFLYFNMYYDLIH